MTDELHPNDVTAMRTEGDFKIYLRGLIKNGRDRLTEAARAAPPPTRAKPPGHRPGAWPAGTQRPSRPPEWDLPKPVIDAGIRHYRNTETRPDQPCDCGNCPDEETTA
ncbi:hypothetical protein [Streptomyces parvulus]|uniref:hypothetical protein n=1 Tax=Streptomyces parvulus TaxID=146923 RepID=UPI00371D7F04